MKLDSRRAFLGTASAAIATRAHPILGASDRVQVAVVGLGGRGRDHINIYAEVPGCRLAAVCDVNQANLERGSALAAKVHGHPPREYSDLRRLLENKEIDAVSIATPNHWHALSAIWSCQAGKDVYLEKPGSHNVFEARQTVAAARQYKRIVQIGAQSRSIGHKRRAIELLRQGIIGKIYLARGLCYRRRQSIGHTPVEPVPAGVNWDIFLGPAPMRPYTKNRYAYNWHWFWDTGNGDIGNQGVHEMDICCWGLEESALPNSVSSTGGKFLWMDDQETPNTQQAVFDFAQRQVTFEVRNLPTGSEAGIPFGGPSVVGNLFLGSDGFMVLHPYGFQIYKGDSREPVAEEKPVEDRIWDPRPHAANFLEAVRARDHRKLNADVAQCTPGAVLCHLANISYRLKRRIEMDSATGRVLNDADANRMLTRPYRAPYVVPESV